MANPAADAASTVSGAASAASIAPSGLAIPRGDTPTWHQIFRDNFTGTTLRKPWTKYNGRPGGASTSQWKASHAVVGGGMLKLETYKENGQWVSGGVGTWNGLSMKYGRIDVRMRAPYAKGVSYVALLWPANGGWPPEIDFAEDGGGNRRSTAATLHYGSSNQQIQRKKAANFAQWHTIGVRWSPNVLTYTLDGKVWATVKHSGVPSTKMVLAIQTQTYACSDPWSECPGSTTPARSSVDIDWVVAYTHK